MQGVAPQAEEEERALGKDGRVGVALQEYAHAAAQPLEHDQKLPFMDRCTAVLSFESGIVREI